MNHIAQEEREVDLTFDHTLKGAEINLNGTMSVPKQDNAKFIESDRSQFQGGTQRYNGDQRQSGRRWEHDDQAK
jgi:hypothetical protein